MSLVLGFLLSLMTFVLGLGVFIGAPWLYGMPLVLFGGIFAGLAMTTVGALAGLPILVTIGLFPAGLVLVGVATAGLSYVGLTPKLRGALHQFYAVLSQAGFARAKLVKPLDSSSVELVATSFDSEKGADEVNLGKITAYIRDVAGLSRYMVNRSFSIVDEFHTAAIDPVVAHVGAMRADYVENNADVIDTEVLDGTGTYENENYDDSVAIGDQLLLPEKPPLVDLEASRFCIFEGAEPGDAEIIEKWTTISQRVFQDSRVVEVMTYAILFLVGIGAVWVAVMLKSRTGGGGGSGGGGGTVVPAKLLLVTAAGGIRGWVER